MATEPTRRLFTIDDYHRMGEAGILTEDDRVAPIRFPDATVSVEHILR